ncbi:hypothetical protein [Larkinella rosea]|uniref:Uncharacterized protein n=1 Tax=Larkinella rosea TaxID=2025312 RepID=A0A3P1BFJ8_9BACT|nr:hypothetical protein [Larkinella rosea]RRA99876.1 hypothetical protein EHT25_24910 [Larkinella rosea]
MIIRPKSNRYYLIHTEPVLSTELMLRDLQTTHRPLPIKLTKQWLTAFGFRPDASAHGWVFEDCRLIPGVNCWLSVHPRRYLQYVHELQDLFEDHYEYSELRLKTGLASLHVPTIRPSTLRLA